MSKKIVLHLTDPLFRNDIIFIAHCPFTDVDRALKRLYPDGYKKLEYDDKPVIFEGWEAGREFKVTNLEGDKPLFIAWAKEPTAIDAADMGWLAHCLFHVCAEILKHAGVTFSTDSEEVYAYMLEWLMNEVTAFLWSNE